MLFLGFTEPSGWIVAMCAPRIASQYSPRGQNATSDDPVLFNGFDTVT